jgi:pilus assembly protein CpaB
VKPSLPTTVQLVDWPAASVPQGAITETEAQAFVSKNNATLRPLVAGEPILQSNTSARAVLSATLPQDQRAVSIPIDFVTGVAGFVKPGDIVDVVLTRAIPGSNATADEQMATIVLQNVAVLAIDVTASTKAAPPSDPAAPQATELPEFKAATLMVDSLGAQKLALATQVGKLTLVLRNSNDRTSAAIATVLPRDLGGGGVRPATAMDRITAASRTAVPRRTGVGSGSHPAAAALPSDDVGAARYTRNCRRCYDQWVLIWPPLNEPFDRGDRRLGCFRRTRWRQLLLRQWRYLRS